MILQQIKERLRELDLMILTALDEKEQEGYEDKSEGVKIINDIYIDVMITERNELIRRLESHKRSN